jgi:hypothetical protein
MAYNMLNYSAVVIPVTKADKELDKRTKEYNSYKPISDTDRKNWEACKYRTKAYDAMLSSNGGFR